MKHKQLMKLELTKYLCPFCRGDWHQLKQPCFLGDYINPKYPVNLLDPDQKHISNSTFYAYFRWLKKFEIYADGKNLYYSIGPFCRFQEESYVNGKIPIENIIKGVKVRALTDGVFIDDFYLHEPWMDYCGKCSDDEGYGCDIRRHYQRWHGESFITLGFEFELGGCIDLKREMFGEEVEPLHSSKY